ncbi:MAG: hypothetical protein QM571_02135 [Micrococcaceae bacterium]
MLEIIMAWCAFIGSWVLVAGPLYQGAMELGELDIDREEIANQAHQIEPPEHISPWWWLVPPAAYIMTKRNQEPWRKKVFANFTAEQREQFVSFSNKSTGWFMVCIGASLIGIDSANSLAETMEWSTTAMIPLIIVAMILCVTFTVVRLHGSKGMLQKYNEEAEEQEA